MPSLMAMLGLNASAFQSGLNSAGALAKSAGGKIGSALSGAIGGQLAAFASIGAIEELSRSTIDYAGHVADLSQRLGISTDAIQAWDYALKLNGSSIDSAAGFFEKLAGARKKALAGNDEAIGSFRNLGVSIDDLKSKRLEDIGTQISRAFEGADPQSLIADLREVGGRGAGEMAAAFTDGFAQIIDGAKGLGVIIDESVIAKLDEAGDRMTTTWTEFRAGIAPALAGLADIFQNLWRSGNEVMRGAVGFVTGGVQGAKDLVAEYRAEVDEADKTAEDRANRRKEARSKGPLNLEETDAKGQRAEDRAAEKMKRSKEELAKLQRDNDLDALDSAGKLAALDDERAQKIKALRNATSEEVAVSTAIEIEKIDKERNSILNKKDPRGQRSNLPVNELQKIGAFTSANADTLILNENKNTNLHLKDIKELLRVRPAGGDTQF